MLSQANTPVDLELQKPALQFPTHGLGERQIAVASTLDSEPSGHGPAVRTLDQGIGAQERPFVEPGGRVVEPAGEHPVQPIEVVLLTLAQRGKEPAEAAGVQIGNLDLVRSEGGRRAVGERIGQTQVPEREGKGRLGAEVVAGTAAVSLQAVQGLGALFVERSQFQVLAGAKSG